MQLKTWKKKLTLENKLQVSVCAEDQTTIEVKTVPRADFITDVVQLYQKYNPPYMGSHLYSLPLSSFLALMVCDVTITLTLRTGGRLHIWLLHVVYVAFVASKDENY